MQKAMFSSPFAALDSTERRIALLQANQTITSDEQSEIIALQEFATSLRNINASSFSKFQRLVEGLKDLPFNSKPAD